MSIPSLDPSSFLFLLERRPWDASLEDEDEEEEEEEEAG